MITKKNAAKFWADYFETYEQEALDCHHMTIDCMVEFAQEQVKNCSTPDVEGQSEQYCEHAVTDQKTLRCICCEECGEILDVLD